MAGVVRLAMAAVFVVLAAAAPPAGVDASRTPRCTISGTNGPDVLIGTPRRDVICGLGGDDVLVGLGGNDLLIGGNGNDSLYGGGMPGGVVVSARLDGADVLQGGSGNDAIDGGAGNDAGSGGAGADSLAGGAGNDDLSGDAGNDVVDGGAGDDTAAGGDGLDNLIGDSGNDDLSGGGGDDTLSGHTGDDDLFGDAGDDMLDGGPGADTFDGGEGTNACSDPSAITTGSGCLLDRPEPSGTAIFPAAANAGDTIDFRFSLASDKPEYVVLWVHDGNSFLAGCAGVTMNETAPPASGGFAWEFSCRLTSPAPDRTYSVWISTIRQNGVSRYAEYGQIVAAGTSSDAAPPALSPAGATVDRGNITLRVGASDETGIAFLWLMIRYPATQVYQGWVGCQQFLTDPGPDGLYRMTCGIPEGAGPGDFSVLVWAGDPLNNRVTEFWTLRIDAAGNAELFR
ncbi:MAG: calcium-binding protein [Chloroflexota bacterium]